MEISGNLDKSEKKRKAELLNFKDSISQLYKNVAHYRSIKYGDTAESFGIKFIYKGKWTLYVAFWIDDILDCKFISSNPPFSYTITISVTDRSYQTNNSTECCDIYQQFYNTWMFGYKFSPQSDHNIKIVISQVRIKTSKVELPCPLQLELYKDSDYITLEGKKSSETVVLQSLLQKNSEVFKQMFSGDWIENKEKRVNIDLSTEGLEEFTSYIYCKTPPRNCARELLMIAHMYEIDHLKYVSAKRLYEEVTAGNENEMEIMSIASTYKYKPLVTAMWLHWEENRNEICL